MSVEIVLCRIPGRKANARTDSMGFGVNGVDPLGEAPEWPRDARSAIYITVGVAQRWSMPSFGAFSLGQNLTAL